MARSPGSLALFALALLLAGCPSKEEGPCPSGQERCGGVCVDPATYQTDANNCGGCGTACGSGTCSGGLCQCTGGTTRCDSLNPRCRDLQTDAGACGSCITTCSAKPGSTCLGGSCGCFGANPDDCTTFCTDTQTDAENCLGAGGCGHPCPLANDVCEAGACACPASLPDLCPTAAPTACVNTDTDPSNCGACGIPCPLTNDVCDAGACACPASLPDVCGATCVNLETDEQHCGTCPNPCPTGATCTSGACQCPIARPTTCGGTCCAGDGCCGSACQTAHANGLGGTYYDCGALDQHTLEQARLAAASWNPGTTQETGLQCGFCLCRVTMTQAAIWCYEGSPNKGLVLVWGSPNCSLACPSPGNGVAWH